MTSVSRMQWPWISQQLCCPALCKALVTSSYSLHTKYTLISVWRSSSHTTSVAQRAVQTSLLSHTQQLKTTAVHILSVSFDTLSVSFEKVGRVVHIAEAGLCHYLAACRGSNMHSVAWEHPKLPVDAQEELQLGTWHVMLSTPTPT